MSFALLAKRPRRFMASALTLAFTLVTLISSYLPRSSAQESAPNTTVTGTYAQANLVSNLPGVALVEDKRLFSPWGLAVGSNTPFWVTNNEQGDYATLYRGDVAGSPLAPNPNPASVAIPNVPTVAPAPAMPTGVVANNTNDFQATLPPFGPQPAQFITVTESGGINAWHSNFGSASASVVVRFLPGHRYTGVTIGSNASGNLLFAADFANGKIDVFDKNFADSSVAGNFVDATIPANFHPNNIQNLNGSLYVTYVRFQAPFGSDLGYVRKFDTNGVRDNGFAINAGPLNDPYGLAIAPANFGAFSNLLLVGNFRSRGPQESSINAFNPATGSQIGSVVDGGGAPIALSRLLGLTFGNGTNGGDPNTLYFVASPPGLFGSLKPIIGTPATTIQFSSAEYFTNEAAGHFDVTVTRTGDLSTTSTVNYATTDSSATQKHNYEIAVGKLTFNPGEASKTFRVLIVDDNLIGAGTFYDVNLVLSNPTNAVLTAPSNARLAIQDNEFDTPKQPENIVDDTQFFVRQQYYDFLNREPDTAGFNFWMNQIASCGTDQACIELKRINVSAAFFLSIEFQQTGVAAYRAEKSTFGGLPRYGYFMRDVQALQKDYVFGAPGAANQLEVNKQAFFNEFVSRPEFAAKYNSLTNEACVRSLLLNAEVGTTTGELYIAELNTFQQVPPNNAPARGVVILRQSRTSPKVFVTLYLDGLSSAETEAHIHGPAPAGSTAPVIVNLPTGQLVNFEITLTTPQFLDLSAGRLYVDVHTANFPNGEIRAQLPSNLFVEDMLVRALNARIISRAEALRLICESEYFDRDTNKAFVLMEYFGYLRRNPDDPPDNNLTGYNFWLNKLNQFNGNFISADMVKAFLRSTEYRGRFGP